MEIAPIVLIEDNKNHAPIVTFLIDGEEHKAEINFSKLVKDSSSGVDFRTYSIGELYIDYLVSDPAYALANRSEPLTIYSCIDNALITALIIIFILESKARRRIVSKNKGGEI